MNKQQLSSSFRDPDGFLFEKDGKLYRQVNNSYKADYDSLMDSGLYAKLTSANLLIPHAEVEHWENSDAYKIIAPEIIPFISYPYEWSFSQFKDAALHTLKVQKTALKHGLSLKDASAYNIQFKDGKPIFIDTLSFEKHKENTPWKAYKQFCQHFLAPLALMSYKDIRLSQLMIRYIDGIPLDLANALLPIKAKLNPSLFMHISLHSKSQKHFENKTLDKEPQMNHYNLLALLDSLYSCVKNLKFKCDSTEWGEYYSFTNYTDSAAECKRQTIEDYLDTIQPETLWDLGANNGAYTRIASTRGINTVAFDIDEIAVEKNYIAIKKNNEKNILPLLLDLTNPSPAIGWANAERPSFAQRALPDAVMALALIHHISISNNVPFDRVAQFLSKLGRHLIIEFVPKSDSQVQKLLATREDVFHSYTKECFETEFKKYYDIISCSAIAGSERFLYLMKQKESL